MMKTYDADLAKRYMEAQEAFFADREDSSRLALWIYLPKDIRDKYILDVGCGYGKDVARYAERGAKVRGSDASEAMIALAKEKYPELEQCFVCETFDGGINLPDNSVDIITSRYALQHILDIDWAYKEFHRVLKPAGEMVHLVAHPLQQFCAKGRARYQQQEDVDVKLYETGTDLGVVVTDFSHTMSDYFTQFVLKNFDLLDFAEQPPKETRENIFTDIPAWMLMNWRKR